MQKDKQERYLELLAGLRLMDDDFFSEALDEKIAPVEYILNTVLERDDIRVLRTEAQVEYKSAANRSIKLDIRAVDAEGRVMDIEVQRADRGAGVRRARFHSSMLDRTLLDKGKDFEDLVDTYVIFITEHDRLVQDCRFTMWKGGLRSWTMHCLAMEHISCMSMDSSAI